MASTAASAESTSASAGVMFATGDTDTRKASSQQFAAQIKQLEIEGSKLVAATDMLSDSLGILGNGSYGGIQSSGERGMFGNGLPVPTTLSALTDISAEQRTISELSLQLDSQSRETERLQRQLYDDATGCYHPLIPGRNALSDLEIPITSHMGTTRVGSYPGTRGADIDFLSMSHVERELRVTKKENAELQERLHELTKVMGQQKEQFRSSVEDLKSQLQDAVHSRNNLLETKQREVVSQEALITDLQNTVKQLEQANKIQEQTLSEMHEKMNNLQKEQYVVTSSFKDVHSILVDYGRRRGRPLPANLEQLPSYEQSIGTLVETLERDACESEADLLRKNENIQQLTNELETVRINWEERYNMLMREHQDRLTRLADDHERQLSLANERSTMATQQVTSLQNQLRTIRDETDHQTRGSYEHICELERALSALKDDRQREHAEWSQKREGLEMAVEQSEKELTMIRAERLEAIRKNAALESRFEGVQETIVRLERECEVEKARVLQLQEKVTEVKGHEEHLTEEIQKKNTLIDQLHQSMGRMQQDYKSQIQSTVASAEKEGVQRTEDRIETLATQLSAVTEKCHALKLEAELTKNEHKNLLEKHAVLSETSESIKQKHDAVIANVEHLNNLLRDRTGDIARLTTERDYYYRLLDEKNAELATVSTLKERFEVQLEEREKNFLALQGTAEKAENSAVTAITTVEAVKHERDTLQQQMNEKIIEMEKLRHERDDLTKKVRIRERYAKEVDTDSGRRKRELSEASALLESATAKNTELMEELRQSRYEVSRLGETIQALEARLHERETELLRQVKTLTHRLKAAENDLRLASKTLKTREVVDGKAVKVAGLMQKEVTEKRSEIDSLNSKIHWLEECMEAAGKHEHILQEDNRKLATTLKRASRQSEKLQTELHDNQCRTRQLHDKINKQEASLEKAVTKCSQMQEKLEHQEQDLARTKLKHQLEVKELARNRPNHRSRTSNRSSSLSPLRTADTKEKSSHAKMEHPVSTKPTKEQLQNIASQNAVGEELRQLLGEMKSLIYGQQQLQLSSKQMPQELSEKTASGRHSSRGGTSSGYRSVTDPDQLLSDLDLYMNLRQDSSRMRQTAEGSMPPERDDNVSSLSHLINSKSTVYAPEWSPNCEPVKDNTPGYQGSCRQAKKKTRPLEEDATVLCSRLEKKIAGLSKLGGQLQHENKKIARMMRDQDKKLKKVKGQITK